MQDGYFTGASVGLLDALSEGMHAMAQPMTVLRATLEIASGNAATVSQYQHAVDASLREMGRVAEAMGYLQELVRIARDAAQVAEVEVATVMELVEEDLRCVFNEAGVGLRVRVPGDLPKVMASAARLRQCLFHLLQHAVKKSDGTVEVVAGAAEGEIRIVVRANAIPKPRQQDGEWRGVIPCLALVETLAKMHGGELKWKADPFEAWLALPAAASSANKLEPGCGSPISHQSPLAQGVA